LPVPTGPLQGERQRLHKFQEDFVRAIYTQKRMSAAGPDEVSAAFEKACNRFEGRGQ